MLTIGVDLASKPNRTAACQVWWRDGTVEVDVPEIGVNDARILELARRADKLGIDVPLGWPEGFVAAVTARHEGRPWPDGDPRMFWFRETDRAVHRQTGRRPLSVSTDRIAIPAMRAAALLGTLALTGRPVNRTGLGRIVEVYPAAALRRWGLSASKYKRNEGVDNRRRLLEGLLGRAPWLGLSSSALTRCEADDNALDALVAALVARAAARGLCEPIPTESTVLAEREGWIALPSPASLERLAETEAT